MAGNEAHLVAERKETFADGVEQLAMIAAWKIRAPDRPPKEHVAHLSEPRRAFEIDQMPRGVAGAVQHLQLARAKRDALTMLKPAIRCEGRDRRKAEALALILQPLDEECVVAMRAQNGAVERGGQLGARAYMVEMTMGKQDGLWLNLEFVNQGKQTFGFAAWVDHHGLAALFAPQQGGVLGKGRDGEQAIVQRIHGEGNS